jgi:hypothetical protein
MSQEQQAAYIISQSVCAMVEAMSMQTLNKERELKGHSLAYTEEQFLNLLDKYCVNHNAVLNFMT